ncbi:uncharacterized protein LOC108864863 [Galendromus occidentalis]|uniref:Uncharacterized protein LOC108864863 n=1 Tax=Galendromus occidentalis TaxID=34638 RepID=A0AAJ7L845_9ACAR|nr:uncharacterized protein LOC108864863 [Galendromus occidentalis]
MPLTFVTSTRGQPMLCLQGYVFRKDRQTNERTTWRCVEKTCKARIATEDDSHGEPPMHTHSPDPVDIKVRGVLSQLRESAAQRPSAKPTALVAEVVGKVESTATLGKLPKPDLLRRRVTHARRRAGPGLPTNPLRREDLIIPPFLKVTTKDVSFLYYDSGEGRSDRIIVFATLANLSLLKESNEWFLDGTFKD